MMALQLQRIFEAHAVKGRVGIYGHTDISTLFGAFDDKLEPWLKEFYDHGMLINVNDPLYETLKDHCRRTGENFKMKLFNGPTSVENLAWMMFTEITEMGFCLSHIEVRETDTSVISYTREDWIRDNRYFASVRSPAVVGILSENCSATGHE